MEQPSYPEYEGKYEGYDSPPDYSQQQPVNTNVVHLSNVAGQPQAHVVTSQPGTTTNVVVMTGQPATGFVNVNPGTKPWSSGLCSCFNDIKSCLCVTFCGLCAATNTSSRLGENGCLTCCVPGAIISLRLKLRLLLGIQGTICNDCLVMTFCGSCALCQMIREMNSAGIPDYGCC